MLLKTIYVRFELLQLRILIKIVLKTQRSTRFNFILKFNCAHIQLAPTSYLSHKARKYRNKKRTARTKNVNMKMQQLPY